MAFWQLSVPTVPETSDGLTNFLWEQGALGVVEEESPGEPPRLRAFFPDTASSTGLLRAVVAYRASLSRMGLPVAPAEPEIAPLLEEAWASAWQQSFPAREVGRRLRVTPPWDNTLAGSGRVSVVVEPGRAFGTGHHGSTEGCLALLDLALAEQPDARILDIGTGTGILAIAAVMLGAPAVLAIDVDPDAIAAARKNAEANGGAERIALAMHGPEDLPEGGRFALVLANLLTHTHLALVPQYARLVAPRGRLILGGILADEDDRVVAALAPAGFTLRRRLVLEGWSSLLLGAGRS
jgi:ribosomal protein L11 methyltransferase